VIIDESLTFSPHTKHAASQGLQSLGRLRFLRHRDQGISAYIARHPTLTAILPRMFWASPAWWLDTQGILGPISVAYNTFARWITGLPKSTNTTKLLTCAYLPPLNIFLDYLSRRYAIRICFLPETHVIHERITLSPGEHLLPGIR
jgi:hypothetical protein